MIQEKIDPESNGEPVRAVPTDLLRRNLDAVFKEHQNAPYSPELRIKVREAVWRVAMLTE